MFFFFSISYIKNTLTVVSLVQIVHGKCNINEPITTEILANNHGVGHIGTLSSSST